MDFRCRTGVCLKLIAGRKPPPDENRSEIEDVPDGVDQLLKVPNVPSKLGRRRGEHLNCKRSYTEEELQAALRDIQSGKLGTRRAAVIYGIPRSTLRNKVYKLALERRTGHSSAKATPSEAAATLVTTTTTTTTVNGTGAKGSSASESLRQLLKSTITQKSLGKGGDREPANNCAEHGGLLDVPDASQLLSSLECTPALGPLFAQSSCQSFIQKCSCIMGTADRVIDGVLRAQFLSSIQQLALQPSKDGHAQLSTPPLPSSEPKLPVVSDLIRLLAKERIAQERSRHHHLPASQPQPPVLLSNHVADSANNVILKIPSYKPATANSAAAPPATAAAPRASTSVSESSSGGNLSLKELIARSISQRVHSPAVSSTTASNSSSSNCSSSEKSPQSNGGNVPVSPPPPAPRGSGGASKPDQQPAGEQKRTRPKRGRYRNYDRDNLLQAVRAVQRGEMSVHRAGTYFGVPHSTLEYKVKERHLLRPKKRPGCTPPPTKGYHHLKLEGADEAGGVAAPFLSADLAKLGSGGFFASQMMRKLQASTCDAEKKGTVPTEGILEALIKSTLDKSMVASAVETSSATAHLPMAEK
ncbi:hypothetical protein IscW_ISCW019047 [Ixodes scapularis]|uniref:HTH psq-type domain-containing protein n=1 Tax=Ixodes scapularis TaxID=6945 RepID=B7PPW5_IXOSC|nr:hypothetical protein IscW_ISCW019047 [Ixodes scapularis]|eukprot:XP_002435807.1 hypothetical protein IscW_ISCW019047 [Ixodes scapularis]